MDLGSQSLRHGGIGLRDVISKLLFVGLESRGDLGVVDRTVCGFFRCQDQFSSHPGQFGGRPLPGLVFRVHHWAFNGRRRRHPRRGWLVGWSSGLIFLGSKVLLVVIESDVQAMTSS